MTKQSSSLYYILVVHEESQELTHVRCHTHKDFQNKHKESTYELKKGKT